MRSRSWLGLGMLMFALPACAQTVTQADIIGAWRMELEYPGRNEKEMVGVMLWPDGLWYYTGGAFLTQNHGGARWRLVGDTLWLANDYAPYFHPMAQPRVRKMLAAHGHLGHLDAEINSNGTPFPVPDSVYWSQAFRDTTSTCAGPNNSPCATWVYRVSKHDRQVSLAALEHLSRPAKYQAIKGALTATGRFNSQIFQNPNLGLKKLAQYHDTLSWVMQRMATRGTLTRDSLLGCAAINEKAGAGGECVRR